MRNGHRRKRRNVPLRERKYAAAKGKDVRKPKSGMFQNWVISYTVINGLPLKMQPALSRVRRPKNVKDVARNVHRLSRRSDICTRRTIAARKFGLLSKNRPILQKARSSALAHARAAITQKPRQFQRMALRKAAIMPAAAETKARQIYSA